MIVKNITIFANYLFALTMPFSHVGGYIASGLGFLFAFGFWKKLRSEPLVLWITVFICYGFLRSFFSAIPQVGYNTMFNYFSHWLLPFMLGYYLSEKKNFFISFWLYYWLLVGLILISVLAYFGIFWKSFGNKYYLVNEDLLKGFKHHIALAALSVNLSYLSFSIALFNEKLNKEKRLLFIFIGLFLIGAVGLTGSRGYYLASGIGLSLFLIWLTIYQKKYLFGGVIFILLITLVAGIYTISPTIRSRLKSVINLSAFKADNGQYVVAEGGGGGAVNANRNAIGSWESFELVDLGNDRVALKTKNGHYVAAEGGGGEAVNAKSTAIGFWETFELVDLGNNKVALKAYNGQYVVAEDGGGGVVNANRDAIGGWETFEKLSVSSEMSVTERIRLYKIAIKEIKDKPIVGFGPGQSVYQRKYFENAGTQNTFDTNGEPKYAHLHSFYLNLTAEFGLLGLLIFIIIFFLIFTKLLAVYKRETSLSQAIGIGLFFGLTTIMIGECFDTHLRGPAVAMDIFWLIGLISGARANQNSNE